VINFIVRGTLPARVRDLYGLAWSAGQERLLDGLALSLRASGGVLPSRMRRGSSGGDYRLVARTEARRLRGSA